MTVVVLVSDLGNPLERLGHIMLPIAVLLIVLWLGITYLPPMLREMSGLLHARKWFDFFMESVVMLAIAGAALFIINAAITGPFDYLNTLNTVIIEDNGDWRLMNVYGMELKRIPAETERKVFIRKQFVQYWADFETGLRVDQLTISIHMKDGSKYVNSPPSTNYNVLKELGYVDCALGHYKTGWFVEKEWVEGCIFKQKITTNSMTIPFHTYTKEGIEAIKSTLK